MAVDYVRSELATVAARLPDAGALAWRSAAQRRFQARLDELNGALTQAMAALDHAAEELSLVVAQGTGAPAARGG